MDPLIYSWELEARRLWTRLRTGRADVRLDVPDGCPMRLGCDPSLSCEIFEVLVLNLIPQIFEALLPKVSHQAPMFQSWHLTSQLYASKDVWTLAETLDLAKQRSSSLQRVWTNALRDGAPAAQVAKLEEDFAKARREKFRYHRDPCKSARSRFGVCTLMQDHEESKKRLLHEEGVAQQALKLNKRDVKHRKRAHESADAFLGSKRRKANADEQRCALRVLPLDFEQQSLAAVRLCRSASGIRAEERVVEKAEAALSREETRLAVEAAWLEKVHPAAGHEADGDGGDDDGGGGPRPPGDSGARRGGDDFQPGNNSAGVGRLLN